MKIRLILLIIFIALFANHAHALGIAPSHYDVVFEQSLEKSFQLKIINNANKDMEVVIYAEGDLAKYITINNPSISISKDEEFKIISYDLNLPASFNKQGVHEAKVVAREMDKPCLYQQK